MPSSPRIAAFRAAPGYSPFWLSFVASDDKVINMGSDEAQQHMSSVSPANPAAGTPKAHSAGPERRPAPEHSFTNWRALHRGTATKVERSGSSYPTKAFRALAAPLSLYVNTQRMRITLSGGTYPDTRLANISPNPLTDFTVLCLVDVHLFLRIQASVVHLLLADGDHDRLALIQVVEVVDMSFLLGSASLRALDCYCRRGRSSSLSRCRPIGGIGRPLPLEEMRSLEFLGCFMTLLIDDEPEESRISLSMRCGEIAGADLPGLYSSHSTTEIGQMMCPVVLHVAGTT